jgi:hypothetical protein
MDVLGGAGICNGRNNFLANAYAAIPIAITVEGANILTRSLIQFGQGLTRSHPHLVHIIKVGMFACLFVCMYVCMYVCRCICIY